MRVPARRRDVTGEGTFAHPVQVYDETILGRNELTFAIPVGFRCPCGDETIHTLDAHGATVKCGDCGRLFELVAYVTDWETPAERYSVMDRIRRILGAPGASSPV